MATKKQKASKKIAYTNAKKVVENEDRGFKPTAFQVPEGMERFVLDKEGKFRVNVIPFVVKEGNPEADEGAVHFRRTYFVHDNIGANNEKHCCPAANWNKPCPICEYRAKLQRTPGVKKEELQALKPKRRELYIFQNLNKDGGPLELYETAHYKSFGELLSNKIDAADEDDPHVNFCHLDDGMTLVIRAKEQTYNGITYKAPTNIEFVPRKAQLDEGMLDDSPCLDDCVVELSYKELKKKFDMSSAPADEEEEEEDTEEESDEEEEEEEEEVAAVKPKKQRGKKPAQEPTAEEHGLGLGDKVIHEEYGRCEIIKVSGDGTSLTLRDEDDEVQKAVSPADCKKVKETGKKAGGKPAKKKEEDWEEEEEDADEEETEEEEAEEEDEDSEEEESEEEEEGEEEEEDEEEEKPKKQRGKK